MTGAGRGRRKPVLTIDALLDGPRPGMADPDGDRAWLDGQRAIAAATQGTEYDVRHVLRLDGRARAEWDARRRQWLIEQGF